MRKRLKINNDTMTTIVILSLLFCGLIVIAGMIAGIFEKDLSAIVDSALRVFGTELGICGVMTIFQRWTAAQDRRAEERRERRRKRNEA